MNPPGARSAAWLCLPAAATIALLSLGPLFQTFFQSFTDAKLATLDRPHGVGLENYAYLLRDPDWWRAVWNTALFTISSVFLETLLGLGIALLLHAKIRARGVLRTAILVPWAIPAVVSARIWAWMFNDFYGVINHVLLALGLIHEPVSWLADPRLSLLTLILVDTWKTTPFMALILLAGLGSIPEHLHEAALVDGASRFQELRRVTLPLLRPALSVAVLFRMLDALRIFDLPFVLTSNSRSTAVVSTYARQQLLDFQDVGYGSAASILIFCLTALLAAAYLSRTAGGLGLRE